MNWKNCVRLIIPTIGIAMSSVVSQGCANSSGAPFHMYDSPLLEGRVESRYPRSRTYDPLELGDHNKPTTRYASSDGADNDGRGGPAIRASNDSGSTEQSAAQNKPKKSRETEESERPLPSLSTTRTGAPATTEASARSADGEATKKEAPKKQATAPPQRGGGESGLAAEYIWSVYGLNGVDFSSKARRSIPTLFRECKERGKIYHSSQPAIGDVVFFHNTGDLNDDGRNNDWYTHAAIVEAHGDGGRTTLLGYRGGEVQRFVMDLESPDAFKTRHGEVANAQLRAKRAEDPPFTQYLAGQLFAGTCSVLGERSELVVIDNWKPGMKLEQ